MEYDKNKKTITFTTTETFGKVIVERARKNPDIAVERKIREFIKEVLEEAYLGSASESYAEDPNYTKPIYNEDMSIDIAAKVTQHACTTDVSIKFTEEYFEGLQSVAERSAAELENLKNEKDFMVLANENSDLNADDTDIDSKITADDVYWVDADIEVAESAKLVLEVLNNHNKNNQ